MAHLDSVRRWAAANDLDPLFVYAVMREESWMDASAVSGAGARGLLQIMPSTGYDLAVRAGLRGFSAADLFVPEVNVRLGARYLRELLDDLDGEVEPASLRPVDAQRQRERPPGEGVLLRRSELERLDGDARSRDGRRLHGSREQERGQHHGSTGPFRR